MKTVVNTIFVVLGMCAAAIGGFWACDKIAYYKYNPGSRPTYYRVDYNNRWRNHKNYSDGWNDCRNFYRGTGRYPFKEERTKDNEDIREI